MRQKINFRLDYLLAQFENKRRTVSPVQTTARCPRSDLHYLKVLHLSVVFHDRRLQLQQVN